MHIALLCSDAALGLSCPGSDLAWQTLPLELAQPKPCPGPQPQPLPWVCICSPRAALPFALVPSLSPCPGFVFAALVLLCPCPVAPPCHCQPIPKLASCVCPSTCAPLPRHKDSHFSSCTMLPPSVLISCQACEPSCRTTAIVRQAWTKNVCASSQM